MHTLALILCSTLAFAQAGSAAPKPDFSGTWTLNVAKSDFGKSPAPESMTSRVEHRDPEVKVHSEVTGAQGSYSSDYTWITDGRDNVNTIRGNEIRATVIWNGPALISNAKTTVNGVALRVVDQWTLSEGSKVLTVTRTIVAPQGSAEQKYVYQK